MIMRVGDMVRIRHDACVAPVWVGVVGLIVEIEQDFGEEVLVYHSVRNGCRPCLWWGTQSLSIISRKSSACRVRKGKV